MYRTKCITMYIAIYIYINLDVNIKYTICVCIEILVVQISLCIYIYMYDMVYLCGCMECSMCMYMNVLIIYTIYTDNDVYNVIIYNITILVAFFPICSGVILLR